MFQKDKCFHMLRILPLLEGLLVPIVLESASVTPHLVESSSRCSCHMQRIPLSEIHMRTPTQRCNREAWGRVVYLSLFSSSRLRRAG